MFAGAAGRSVAGLGESLDDIRNEDDSHSESDISDSKLFGNRTLQKSDINT